MIIAQAIDATTCRQCRADVIYGNLGTKVSKKHAVNLPPNDIPQHPIWLLRLVFQFPYGGWLSGMLIFVAILASFWTFAEFGEVGILAILFLAGMVAYIIPVYSLIIHRSEQAFDALEDLLDADIASKRRWRQSLRHRSTVWMFTTAGAGLSLGIAHSAILEMERGGSIGTIFTNSASATVTALATITVWTTLTIVITSISSNASLFYQLGCDHLRVNLLTAGDLVPLAWVSVASTLTLIGAQALFALLIFDPGAGYQALLPGFIATAIPMVPMFLLPVWSVHKRLQLAKARELQTINTQLRELTRNQDSPSTQLSELPVLTDLLNYRQAIASVHEWPFDMNAVSRLGIYLIIPPITWVGAAIIENLVENLL